MHFAVFLRTLRHILQKPQGIYTVKTFRKTWVRKKMAQAASNSVILAQKKIKSKTKQNKSKQLKNKQIKTGMNTTFHVVIKI